MILDLSTLPTPTDWKQGVAGYSVCRDACLPTSTQKATAWAKRHKRNGCRLLRAHKFDGYLTSDLAYQQFQWFLNALQRQGIKVAIEYSCERPLTVEGIRRLNRLDLSNVVMAAIKNETVLDDYAKWEAVIRDSGYTGLLFGSNASMMGGEFGEVESIHTYCGHPRGDYFFDCSYPDHSDHNAEPNDLVRKTSLPFCVMECGTVYPNPQRGMSDVKMYQKFLELGASAICTFAYCSSAWSMDASFGEDMWGIAADPPRLMAFQWLAQKMQGIDAVPFSNGLRAVPEPDAVYLSSPTYKLI
jgi:hypothetical protein